MADRSEQGGGNPDFQLRNRGVNPDFALNTEEERRSNRREVVQAPVQEAPPVNPDFQLTPLPDNASMVDAYWDRYKDYHEIAPYDPWSGVKDPTSEGIEYKQVDPAPYELEYTNNRKKYEVLQDPLLLEEEIKRRDAETLTRIAMVRNTLRAEQEREVQQLREQLEQGKTTIRYLSNDEIRSVVEKVGIAELEEVPDILETSPFQKLSKKRRLDAPVPGAAPAPDTTPRPTPTAQETTPAATTTRPPQERPAPTATETTTPPETEARPQLLENRLDVPINLDVIIPENDRNQRLTHYRDPNNQPVPITQAIAEISGNLNRNPDDVIQRYGMSDLIRSEDVQSATAPNTIDAQKAHILYDGLRIQRIVADIYPPLRGDIQRNIHEHHQPSEQALNDVRAAVRAHVEATNPPNVDTATEVLLTQYIQRFIARIAQMIQENTDPSVRRDTQAAYLQFRRRAIRELLAETDVHAVLPTTSPEQLLAAFSVQETYVTALMTLRREMMNWYRRTNGLPELAGPPQQEAEEEQEELQFDDPLLQEAFNYHFRLDERVTPAQLGQFLRDYRTDNTAIAHDLEIIRANMDKTPKEMLALLGLTGLVSPRDIQTEGNYEPRNVVDFDDLKRLVDAVRMKHIAEERIFPLIEDDIHERISTRYPHSQHANVHVYDSLRRYFTDHPPTLPPLVHAIGIPDDERTRIERDRREQAIEDETNTIFDEYREEFQRQMNILSVPLITPGAIPEFTMLPEKIIRLQAASEVVAQIRVERPGIVAIPPEQFLAAMSIQDVYEKADRELKEKVFAAYKRLPGKGDAPDVQWPDGTRPTPPDAGAPPRPPEPRRPTPPAPEELNETEWQERRTANIQRIERQLRENIQHHRQAADNTLLNDTIDVEPLNTHEIIPYQQIVDNLEAYRGARGEPVRQEVENMSAEQILRRWGLENRYTVEDVENPDNRDEILDDIYIAEYVRTLMQDGMSFIPNLIASEAPNTYAAYQEATHAGHDIYQYLPAFSERVEELKDRVPDDTDEQHHARVAADIYRIYRANLPHPDHPENFTEQQFLAALLLARSIVNMEDTMFNEISDMLEARAAAPATEDTITTPPPPPAEPTDRRWRVRGPRELARRARQGIHSLIHGVVEVPDESLRHDIENGLLRNSFDIQINTREVLDRDAFLQQLEEYRGPRGNGIRAEVATMEPDEIIQRWRLHDFLTPQQVADPAQRNRLFDLIYLSRIGQSLISRREQWEVIQDELQEASPQSLEAWDTGENIPHGLYDGLVREFQQRVVDLSHHSRVHANEAPAIQINRNRLRAAQEVFATHRGELPADITPEVLLANFSITESLAQIEPAILKDLYNRYNNIQPREPEVGLLQKTKEKLQRLSRGVRNVVQFEQEGTPYELTEGLLIRPIAVRDVVTEEYLEPFHFRRRLAAYRGTMTDAFGSFRRRSERGEEIRNQINGMNPEDVLAEWGLLQLFTEDDVRDPAQRDRLLDTIYTREIAREVYEDHREDIRDEIREVSAQSVDIYDNLINVVPTILPEFMSRIADARRAIYATSPNIPEIQATQLLTRERVRIAGDFFNRYRDQMPAGVTEAQLLAALSVGETLLSVKDELFSDLYETNNPA